MLPLLVLLRAMDVLGSVRLFLGFSDLQMALSALASSSFVSELQGKAGTLILTPSCSPHCVKCHSNPQLETAVVSKGWQKNRERWEGKGTHCVSALWDPEVLQPYNSAVSYA